MARINLLSVGLAAAALASVATILIGNEHQRRAAKAFVEWINAERGVSYSCGFLQGQRSYAPIGIEIPDAPDFCAEHRQNAKQHGFTEGKNP